MVPAVDNRFDRHGGYRGIVATAARVVGAFCYGDYSGRCAVVVRFLSVVPAKHASKVSSV